MLRLRAANKAMLTPEENVKLISLVKEQPLLYANFSFDSDVDQQIEVLKFEAWENISKAMNMESKFSVSFIPIVYFEFLKKLLR